MKKKLFTEKEVEEERQKSYDLGVKQGRSNWFTFLKTSDALEAVKLIDALTSFLDNRYEFKKEEYD